MAVKTIIDNNPSLSLNVRDTLAYYGGEGISDNHLSFFQRSANVDEWSKRKPYRILGRTQFEMTEEERKANGRDSASQCGGYGIQIVSVYNSSLKSLYDAVVRRKNNGYTYLRPAGTQSGKVVEPFVMGDFMGYTPLAVMPVTHTFKEGQKIYDQDATIAISGGMNIYDASLEGQIRIEDLYPEGANRGMLVVYKDDSNVERALWATTNIPYAGQGTQLTLGSWASLLNGRDAVAMEFFTNYRANANSNESKIGEGIVPAWTATPSEGNIWFAAIPDPIRNISFAKTMTAKPNTPSARLKCWIDVSYAKYTDTANTRVSVKFAFSSQGADYGGGTLSSVKYGIYANRACTLPIEERTMASFQLANNSRKEVTAFFNNKTGNDLAYFGVWADGYLQTGDNQTGAGIPVALVVDAAISGM